MKALLCIVAAIAVSGCVAVNYQTLDEATDALTDESLSAEDREATREWIERFERHAEKAERHFLIREACFRDSNYIWACHGRERYDPERPPKTLEDLVAAYRADRGVCGCTKREDAFRWLNQ